MRTIVSCDETFEILTRAPFPTGNPIDVDVEEHLRACHECRTMAEALRPAVGLFHEALAADEAEALPQFDGILENGILENGILESSGGSPWRATVDLANPAQPSRSWLGSAIAVAVTLAAVLGATMKPRLAELDRLWPSLPAACLPDESLELRTVVLVNGQKKQCCSVCHRPDSQPAAVATAALVANCQTCHQLDSQLHMDRLSLRRMPQASAPRLLRGCSDSFPTRPALPAQSTVERTRSLLKLRLAIAKVAECPVRVGQESARYVPSNRVVAVVSKNQTDAVGSDGLTHRTRQPVLRLAKLFRRDHLTRSWRSSSAFA